MMKGSGAVSGSKDRLVPAPSDGSEASFFSPGGAFDRYPGPVLLVGHNAIVLANNAIGEPIGELLRSTGHNELREAVRAALEGVTAQVNPLILDSLNERGHARSYDLIALPWAQGTAALLLGRDITLERSLRAVLVESRQRFKDLVDLAADFAWECDCEGRFTYLSREVVLGHLAGDLIGREAASIALRGRNSTPLPFTADAPRYDVEAWLATADGGEVCLAVTSVPLFDEAANKVGSRGLCRDVTATRRQRSEDANTRYRERLLGYVLQLVRDQLDPATMLEAAVGALLLATGARGVSIYRLDLETKLERQSQAGESFPRGLERALLKDIGTDDCIDRSHPKGRVIARLTRLQDRPNGILALWRQPDDAPWDEEARELVEQVADEVASAVEQLNREQELKRLSQTDPVTGLLNPRGFRGHLDRRLESATGKTKSALFYIDLDDFKQVNDTAGHRKGDEVLAALGQFIGEQIRSGDLAGRLGGDEFALYFEGMDRTAASKKAEVLLTGWRRRLAKLTGVPCEVGLSIGIAPVDARTQETSKAIIDRADRAMYQAKRAGKGQFLIAKTPTKRTRIGQ
jgi:diguanylate cyclase (GGDEF)-like protein/PAS domain S-box-containing protein